VMSQPLELDVAIFGGGVAGLWTLARLIKQGFNAHLFECNQLGAGQSIASQGIIHGGTKYALTGKSPALLKRFERCHRFGVTVCPVEVILTFPL